MKQLTVQVETPAGYDCGIKNIMSAHWNSRGELELLVVDFIRDVETKEYTVFKKRNGIFTNSHGNLIAYLINNK